MLYVFSINLVKVLRRREYVGLFDRAVLTEAWKAGGFQVPISQYRYTFNHGPTTQVSN